MKGAKSVLKALLKATDLNPTNPSAWDNLGILHDVQGRRCDFINIRIIMDFELKDHGF